MPLSHASNYQFTIGDVVQRGRWGNALRTYQFDAGSPVNCNCGSRPTLYEVAFVVPAAAVHLASKLALQCVASNTSWKHPSNDTIKAKSPLA
ncbi:hypothetical protein [Paraburkholderia bannensis]|uniref:hypothetical protein n=1 Tax=Paraburkholderia bannensis TaxID=765414 RepID=UPI002AB11880|nr:hypothetical protein [Paraburkholderia bannensis]